jgi:hypothetical protein
VDVDRLEPSDAADFAADLGEALGDLERLTMRLRQRGGNV